MKIERKDDPGRSVRTPEQRSDSILGCFSESPVPEQKFPVERPAFAPERRAEKLAVRPVTARHKLLQMMAGNQFVMRDGTGKMRIIAAQAHHLLLVRHTAGRIRDEDRFAAEKKRCDKLAFGRHHLHPPRFLGQFRNGHEVVLFHVLDRFAGLIADQRRLLAGLDIFLLHGLDRLHIVVAEAHLTRRLFQLGYAPFEFLVSDLDQFLGRVRNHLELEFFDQTPRCRSGRR